MTTSLVTSSARAGNSAVTALASMHSLTQGPAREGKHCIDCTYQSHACLQHVERVTALAARQLIAKSPKYQPRGSPMQDAGLKIVFLQPTSLACQRNDLRWPNFTRFLLSSHALSSFLTWPEWHSMPRFCFPRDPLLSPPHSPHHRYHLRMRAYTRDEQAPVRRECGRRHGDLSGV